MKHSPLEQSVTDLRMNLSTTAQASAAEVADASIILPMPEVRMAGLGDTIDGKWMSAP